jgi:2-succinyl-5-enolpyruvyl-6-hydroxy-3-cyclohexene-1-carboxylate synthase
MTQVQWAKEFLSFLADSGVKDIVVCAGNRNKIFIEILAKQSGFNIYSGFEERSAGFFALGKSSYSGRPTVVLTTSGTAVAELLPSVIEAHYSYLPLWIVSADRPANYRGSGAPQAIEQADIFSPYAESQFDLEAGGSLPDVKKWRGQPVHFNICIDEPMVDDEIGETTFKVGEYELMDAIDTQTFFSPDISSPLIVLSNMTFDEAQFVAMRLKKVNYTAVYCESTSRLRGHSEVTQLEVTEELVGHWLKSGHFDSLIRVGGVPTGRFWRDLENDTRSLPVYVFSNKDFSGTSRMDVDVYPLDRFEEILDGYQNWSSLHPKVIDQEVALSGICRQMIQRYPKSEPALIQKVSKWVDSEDNVYLGNSLPIRNWNSFASPVESIVGVWASRGANGIDGQLATFLGGASEDPDGKVHWAILGDLTALYDMNSLFWVKDLPQDSQVRIVVVNNSGGRIFERFSKSPLFLTNTI